MLVGALRRATRRRCARSWGRTRGARPRARAGADEALAGVDALCLEVLELSFEALASARSRRPTTPLPVPGPVSFRADDRAFFFGREELVERLRERLAEHPFLAVLGPSGSGKSSLVLAGLVPALRDGTSRALR